MNELYDARPHPQIHAIIACALGRDPVTAARYTGRPTKTSDGFVMCDFVAPNGDHHMGAFVGAHADIVAELNEVIDSLPRSKRDEARLLLKDWL